MLERMSFQTFVRMRCREGCDIVWCEQFPPVAEGSHISSLFFNSE